MAQKVIYLPSGSILRSVMQIEIINYQSYFSFGLGGSCSRLIQRATTSLLLDEKSRDMLLRRFKGILLHSILYFMMVFWYSYSAQYSMFIVDT